MSIDIPQAQVNFFAEHRYLALEDYLTATQTQLLRALSLELLTQRIGHLPTTFDDAYRAGHDLWRVDPLLAKWAQKKELAAIAAALTNTSRIRFAYDQILLSGSSNLVITKNPVTLTDISSVSPLVCGLIINLSKAPFPSDIFPPPGGLLFFAPDFPLELIQKDQCCLLVAYTNVKPLYIQNPLDPHSHIYKSLGYGSGDFFSTEDMPFLH